MMKVMTTRRMKTMSELFWTTWRVALSLPGAGGIARPGE
jgi:hypothetical protein